MNCFFFSGLSCVNLWTGGQAGLAISYYFATFSILKQKRQQTAGNSFAAAVSYNPDAPSSRQQPQNYCKS
jgi:hypothetical protein